MGGNCDSNLDQPSSRITRDSKRVAVMATLIMTVERNDIDPQAWLADRPARIAHFPQGQLHELLQ